MKHILLKILQNLQITIASNSSKKLLKNITNI